MKTGSIIAKAKLIRLSTLGVLKCIRVEIVFLATLLIAARSQLVAQVTSGSVIGVVYDSSGAVIPNCKIVATDIDTGAAHETHTTDSGYYTIPALPPDVYKLRATARGFAVTDTQLTVLLGNTANFDFHLAPSSISQSVEVSAASSVLELNTSNHQVASLLPSRGIENLPANGRDVFQTLLSLPNVSPFQNTVGPVSNYRTTTNSVTSGGSASGMTTYLQDGVTNVAMVSKTANFQPPIEATQEVSVVQSGASARFDEPAVVNVITKNGTNAFHGRAYDYLQNDVVNTVGYFKAPKPPLRYNQFGANIGGPILRNKLFFFFDYAGLRNTTGTTLHAFVPTVAERTGDFSADSFTIYDPATYNAATGAISPFPYNKIPPGRISNFASLYMLYFPNPTPTSIPGANFQKNVNNTTTYDSYLARMDYTIGSHDAAYGAYETTTPSIVNPTFSASPIFNYLNTQSAENAYVQETHIFGATTVNIARFAYNESNIGYTQNAGHTNYVQMFGLNNLDPQPMQYQPPQVSMTTHTGLGNLTDPTTTLQRLFEVVDEMDLTRGKHDIYIGGVLDRLTLNNDWVFGNDGSYTFDGEFTSNQQLTSRGGSDLADLLLGLPYNAEGGTGVTTADFRSWNVSPYVQDDWRVSKRLTLNLGLRYDYYGAPADANGHSNVYDVYTNTNHPGTFRQQYLTFAPRVGFAFALDKTTLHGGYGIYYSPFQTNQLEFLMVNEPNFHLQSNTYTIADPTLVTNVFVANPSLSAEAPFAFELNFKTPYVQQLNLEVQKSLGAQWLASISYLGNRSSHLQIRQNPNQASLPTNPSNPGTIASRRPYSWVGDVFQISSIGYGNYNGLIGDLERNFSNGISLSTNFVWSKSMDTLNNGAQDPQYGPDVQAEYGQSDFNAGKVFKVSGTYELPFGPGRQFMGAKNWFDNEVIGGWQASGILIVQSGLPFSISATDLSDTGGDHTMRAHQTCNGNRPHGQSFTHWFNTSCYAQPAEYTFGNEQRDNILGPRTTNLDMSFFKAFALSEGKSMQFRTDFFDILNHPEPTAANVSATVSSASYGKLASVPGNRIVQFSLKLTF